MRFLIAGSGAVGGYYGAKLAQSGQDVTMLARGKILEALQAQELAIESYEGDFKIKLHAVPSIDGLETPDVIIIATKTYDTDAILEQIAPAAGPNTLLISLQNGVESEQKMIAKFGDKNVLGAVCYIGSEVTEPGKIRHSADGQVAIGELDGTVSDRVKKLGAIFEAAGITVTVSDNIQRLLWKKLLWNAPFNQLCAAMRASVGELLDSEHMWKLLRQVGEEVVAVAQANNVMLSEQDIEDHLNFSDKKLRAVRPSLLQDLERGRRLEHEILGGFLLREGRRLDVDTPVNETLHRCLSFLDPSC